MSARAWLPALAALALAGAGAAHAAAPASGATAASVDYGLFGTLHLRRPAGTAAHVVVLISDRDGWSARSDALAAAVAGQGALVVGIDLPAYLARMESIADACAYPSGHFEEVAHWIEREEGLPTYVYPLVVGDGAGATFAYAMTAQAPAGTFEGLITLGWDASLRFPKEFCAGDLGPMTAPADGAFGVVPTARAALRWLPQPFAAGARVDGIGAALASAWRAAGALLPPFAEADAATGLAHAYADWRRGADAAPAALPDDVADLPLIEIAPAHASAAAPHLVAIVVTGDGGWAGLDRGVADALTAQGVSVVGFSTLKFFWHAQTPDAAAQAIARVIAHYGKADAEAGFVLIGYSFGASLVPVVINRLPDAARQRVRAGVMISPD
ncbi:MAG TPA: AcvB/VirJ family lysyl-phosphatidylglycerol hydrolase, partial [Dokdonella sp.]